MSRPTAFLSVLGSGAFRSTAFRLGVFLAAVLTTWAVLWLGDSDAGGRLTVGAPAPEEYKAEKAGEVVDTVATEAARQDARDSVGPVYDLDPDKEASAVAAIIELFADLEATAVGDEPPNPPAAPELPEEETPEPADEASTTTTAAERAPVALSGRVFLDVDGDGDYDPDAEGDRVDEGLARVAVSVLDRGGAAETRTNNEGVWSHDLDGAAAVVTVEASDEEIPNGWAAAPKVLAQLVECDRWAECVAEPIAIAPNLRPLPDVEKRVGAEYELSEETIEYLAATASDDVVRDGIDEVLHLPVVKQAVLDRMQREFGQRIEEHQLEEFKNTQSTSPPLVFHSDTGQDLAGGQAAGEIVAAHLVANYRLDETATEEKREEAAEAVPDVTVGYVTDQLIVARGVPMTQLHIDAIAETARFASAQQAPLRLLAVIAVLVASAGLYLSRLRSQFWARPRLVALLAILFVAAGGAVRLAVLLHEGAGWYVIPVVAVGFATAVLFDQRVAGLMALSIGVLTAAGTLDVGVTAYAALAALAPIPFVSSVSTRGAFRNAVVFSALAAAGIASVTSWFFHVGPVDNALVVVGQSAAWAFGVSAVAALLGLASLQFLESAFDVTTTLGLLDLTDRNHKALQLLQEEAFGTFNHSLMVGTLADAAARSIGADPLLARAMAYYHDLGKTESPAMFIENQFGTANPHDSMAPEDSAAVIRGHVTVGLELARRFKIPGDVAQGISSHHGDGVMRYFYEKARAERGEDVDIDDFRHAGQKPRTEETAILMLADSLEAACRAVFQTEEPTPDAIEKLVNAVVDEKLEDGQLSESPLTLGELTKIRAAFLDSLVGHYHQRIAYPNFPGA